MGLRQDPPKFMANTDWSDDDLEEEDLDMAVMPMPTPQIIGGDGDPKFRATAYNERMARARQATMLQRKGSSGGIIQSSAENRPVSRPNTGSLTLHAQPAAVDAMSREIEQMALEEQQQERDAAELQRRNEEQREQEATPPPASYADPIDIGDDGPVAPTQHISHHQQKSPSYPTSSPEPVSPPAERERATTTLASVPRPLEPASPASMDTSDLRAFLMRPGPQGAMVQCYIQRRKSGLARLYPTYEVYLKEGEKFMLAARRRKKQKQSNYKVSLDRDDLGRHSSNFFGKLKSNFMGTEFQMYDHGVNPEKLTDDQKEGSRSQVRQELATVLYKQNVLGSRGPRKMKVIVPNVDDEGNRVVLRPTEQEDTMIERYKAGKELDDVQVLKNKQPKWNDQVGAYVLNFNGRVTRASVKNFQLCNVAKDPDLVVMQFGRVGKDAFTMDFQWPLCGLQAFGIALSSFDYKIACE